MRLLLLLTLTLGAARFSHQEATGKSLDEFPQNPPDVQPPKISDTTTNLGPADEFDPDTEERRLFRRQCVRDCIFEHCKPECDQDWNCYRGCIPVCNQGCKDRIQKLWDWVRNIFEGVHTYDKVTKIIEAIEAGEKHPEGVSLPGAPRPE